jgi:hypothetical protein
MATNSMGVALRLNIKEIDYTPKLSEPVFVVSEAGVGAGGVGVQPRTVIVTVTGVGAIATTGVPVLPTVVDSCESSAAKFVLNPRSSLNLSAAAPVSPSVSAVF